MNLELENRYRIISALLLMNGLLLGAVWAALTADITPKAVLFIQPYVHLGEVFSPLTGAVAMLAAGVGLISRRRFGFVLTAYTLTVWMLLSVVAMFSAPLSEAVIAAANLAVFGSALYLVLEEKDLFTQELPEVIQMISFLMFLGGWIGMSYGVNHILYTSTLGVTLMFGGGLLMMEAAIGLAAKSRVGLWFSMGVLLTAVVVDSGFLLFDSGYQYFYRLTLNAVGFYYLHHHQDAFYS